MLDLLLGSACLFLPPQVQAGIVGGTFVFNAIRRRRKRRRQQMNTDDSIRNGNEVQLEWSSVTCRLKSKEGLDRLLLDNLHGTAKPGRILAIFGPSGSGRLLYSLDRWVWSFLVSRASPAGKTTLLGTLAGQLPYSKKLELEGYVTANGNQMPSQKIKTGFVAQEDLFFSQMTVRETLAMAAEMRTRGSPEERDGLVDSVIRSLGLSICADTVIGDEKTRGLSGGEKKRLSIACEMIAKPSLLFADEPTSGLDSFSAQQVVGSLKTLASEGNTVVMSIHQPRSSIFEMLDDVCLLSEGKLIYFGESSKVLEYFEALGYTCPEHYNPAEFLADLVAIDHSSPETEKESMARVTALADAWNKAHKSEDATAKDTNLVSDDGTGSTKNPGCSFPRQVMLLLNRSWKQISRDKATLLSRASSQVSSAIVFSAIYWKLGLKQADIQSRLGLIQVSAVGTAMSSLIKTLNVFPQERTIIQRERGRSAYPVISYFASKLAAELPVGSIFPMLFGAIVYPCTGLSMKPIKFARFLGILVAESFSAQALGLAVGAAAPSTSAALAIGPAVILVSIVFGGLFVNVEGVPTALKWIPKTSLIKHAFEGACINEFTGLSFDCGKDAQGNPRTKSGQDVLQELGAGHDTIQETLVSQGRVLLMYWWMAYRILKKKKPRYMELVAPQKAMT